MRSQRSIRVQHWLWLALAACGSAPTEPPPSTAPPLAGASAADRRTVTLITGDRVIVASDGEAAVHVEPGPGRERVGFVTQRLNGETMVIPHDVAPLIASGQIDRYLFSVTELLAQGYDDAQRDDLPLIMTGQVETATARSRLASAELAVRRVMPALHTVAVRRSKQASSSVVAQLADAPGQRIWLDRRFHLSLDHSVPQIGAPAAWASGFTGAGVVVAVLDSGIDAQHPDLAGKVEEAVSFVDDGLGVSDVNGHGTHVASIIAGSGAASEGQFRGVAPDATLISGRVCDVFGCAFSAILAGMEWAVATKHARVVNFSVGGGDTPEVDPIEEAVNRLSADHGALFVVAAGNTGRSGAATVQSPSTADAALSVGAVDRGDQLAVFSSRGPRLGDFAVKPEITAPGVEIVAARAALDRPPLGTPVGTSYQKLSGTSMATPHVAGAAAILLQQHPGWTGAQLKAALIASANPSPTQTAFEQGAGRVDVARAIGQDVVAEPATVAFGQASFPHDDDPILQRTVTYRNDGATPVTLAVTGSLQQGTIATGMLAISPASITVPAGGTADVTLTVDTRGDLPFGAFAGELVAAGDDVRVVTPMSVAREDDTLELTFEAVDDVGTPTGGFGTLIGGPRGFQFFHPPTTLRLAPGSYTAYFVPFPRFIAMVYPRLELAQDTTVLLDGRLSRPSEVSVPDQPLVIEHMQVVYIDPGRLELSFTNVPQLFPTVQLGPAPPPGVLSYAAVDAVPAGSTDGSSFYVFGHVERNGWMTGFTETGTPDRVATVHARHRASADQSYRKFAYGTLPELGLRTPDDSATFEYQGAFERTEHYVGDDLLWIPVLNRLGDEVDPFTGERLPTTRQGYVGAYRPGHTYVEGWNHAPFGPAFSQIVGFPRAIRSGNVLAVQPTLFSEVSRPSRIGLSLGSLRQALFRDGVLAAEQIDEGLELFDPIEVPAERATYRFEADATRPAEISELSPHVTAAWTFSSAHTDASQVIPLPTLRFAPPLDDSNSAPRRLPMILAVEVERPDGAPTPTLKDATVEASFDDGATWSPVPGALVGTHFIGIVIHPPKAAFASLRGTAADVDGNRVEQTIIRAYKLR